MASGRRKGRIIALQALYSWACNGEPLEDLLDFEWVDQEKKERLGEDFVRIHQRYLVRADAVSHIGSSSVEIGERTLPVSRSLREAATVKLAKAMLAG